MACCFLCFVQPSSCPPKSRPGKDLARSCVIIFVCAPKRQECAQKQAPLKQTAYYTNDICEGTSIDILCRPVSTKAGYRGYGCGCKWDSAPMTIDNWRGCWPGWTTSGKWSRRLPELMDGCQDLWICLFLVCQWHVLDSMSSVRWCALVCPPVYLFASGLVSSVRL